MESEIKCLECGKITRNFELGNLFYDVRNPSETMILERSIICPKCHKDISNEKCAIKKNYTLIRFVAANISLSIGEVPKHLKGTYSLNESEYKKIITHCKSKPKLVNKF